MTDFIMKMVYAEIQKREIEKWSKSRPKCPHCGCSSFHTSSHGTFEIHECNGYDCGYEYRTAIKQ